jgi:hypothetical protein
VLFHPNVPSTAFLDQVIYPAGVGLKVKFHSIGWLQELRFELVATEDK